LLRCEARMPRKFEHHVSVGLWGRELHPCITRINLALYTHQSCLRPPKPTFAYALAVTGKRNDCTGGACTSTTGDCHDDQLACADGLLAHHAASCRCVQKSRGAGAVLLAAELWRPPVRPATPEGGSWICSSCCRDSHARRHHLGATTICEIIQFLW
jgi:hypothetical protein